MFGKKSKGTLCAALLVMQIATVQFAIAKPLPVSTLINAEGSLEPDAEATVRNFTGASLVRDDGSPIFTTVDDIEGEVSHLCVAGGKLYVAGRFKKADRRVVNNVAVWDGTKWSGLGKGVDGTVKALCAVGNDIIVAGDFSYVDKSDDNPGIEANRLARWDGKKWNTYTKVNIDREIFALASDGKTLYIGGNFKKIENKTDAASVAMWDGKGWKPVGGSKFDKSVLAMTCAGGKLYVGGFFTTIGDEPAANIAVWDGKAWAEVGKKGLDNTVNVLATDGKNIYAGGGVSKAGDGTDMKGLAMWNGEKWSAVGDGPGGKAMSIHCDGGKIYVAGSLAKSGMGASWDGSAWTLYPELIYASARAVAFYNGALYLGGNTNDTKDPVLKGNILKWNGTGYEPLAK